MSAAVVKYNLNDPNDKIQFESAANGFRYRRVLQKLIGQMGGPIFTASNGVVLSSRVILAEIRTAAAAEGLTDIRDLADSALKERG